MDIVNVIIWEEMTLTARAKRVQNWFRLHIKIIFLKSRPNPCYRARWKRYWQWRLTSGRLIPDILHSVEQDKSLVLRYPDAVKIWHVLEPLSGYLMLAQKSWDNQKSLLVHGTLAIKG